MPRPRKEGTKVSFVINNDILQNLDIFCDSTGRTKTKVVELALVGYMNEHKNEISDFNCDDLNFSDVADR